MRRALLFLAMFFVSVVSFAQTATTTVLYSYTDQDGDDPYTGLIQGSDGNFYGTAPASGANGVGTVYKITPSGTMTTLYNFTLGDDGGLPQAPLVEGNDGNFYGTTGAGGANQSGTVFKITPAGVLTTLYAFTGNNDGANPYAGLTLGSDGNFYGIATNGGASSAGTVFKLTPDGTFTLLYGFTGINDGANPYAGLVQGTDGNFYGVTPYGGQNEAGTIFQITPTGTFNAIYSLNGTTDGSSSQAGLVAGSDGNFYGTTENGGANALGSIFKVTPGGAFTTIYSFTGNDDGSGPVNTLLLGSDGNFYGGTTSGNGTLFEVTPAGVLTTLTTFAGGTAGKDPRATLIQGSDGNLYGVLAFGGAHTDGAVFAAAVSPALAAPVQLSLTNSSIALGSSTTLSWKVLNAFSASMQQCAAFVPGTTPGASIWTGAQTGTLSGGAYAGSATITPTAEGTFTYVLTCGGQETGSVSLVVGAPAPVAITTSSLPGGVTGTAYSTTLAATGGVPPYTWSVAAGNLPDGLTLAASTGVISGTPTEVGVTDLTIQVIDSQATPVEATADLNLTVTTATPTISVNPTAVSIASPGGSGSATLSVSGFSSNTISFSCSGLPSGAACTFGALSGTGSVGTATMQVTTTAPATASAARTKGGLPITYALAMPGLLALGALFRARRRKNGLWGNALMLAMLFFVGLTLSACGGSSTPAGNEGTPAGTSTVTVTATAGTQSATGTVTLTVQ